MQLVRGQVLTASESTLDMASFLFPHCPSPHAGRQLGRSILIALRTGCCCIKQRKRQISLFLECQIFRRKDHEKEQGLLLLDKKMIP